MTVETTLLLDGLGFPEGPRWHDGKLWFSDFRTRKIMTVDLEGNAETIAKVQGQPSGLGWLPDQSLLVVSMVDRRLLRLHNSTLSEFANLSGLTSSYCNDMVVDHSGRAYIGNFGSLLFEQPYRPAGVILVTPTGEARVVAGEMAFPNGSVITPDGETLIVGESLAARLTAFDIETDGSLSHRRVWAQFDDLGLLSRRAETINRITPDGICLDAEGAVWVASPNSRSELVRVREGGEITHRFELEHTPFACMLGGPDRLTLFVLTSSLYESNGAGRIETIRVDVPGAGLP
ncbi:MAG: SMP-30/gluconolactonase/LRE family protein [Syntrophales bacterium]|nr:SMP-30/gluconolactonase/LRE family protein [Syntrophales bacterium]